MRIQIQATLVAFCLVVGSTVVPAADNSWTNSTGSKWETAANWSLGAAPASSQSRVLITNSTTKTIRIDGSTTAGSLTVSNLTLSASNAVNSLLLSNATTALRILDAFTNDIGGVVTITNSTLRVDGIKTNGFYNDGSLTLLNAGLLLLTNIFTSVGNATNGSILIRGGTARIGDIGVGEFDAGALTVVGGTLTLWGNATSILAIGDYAGSTGAVWITGGTVLLTNDATFVGFAGDGSFTVSNVTVKTSDFIVGELSAGTLTVASGTLSVSSLGAGTLVVGEFTGSTGSVWVTGGQLLVPDDATTIGGDGSGQLTVSNGTASLADLTVGNFAAGTLTVAGGTLTVAVGQFTNLNIGAFFEASGLVRVTGGQLLAGAVTTIIGNSGPGNMLINGGSVSSRDVLIGGFFGSSGTLTLTGGTNILSSSLLLGGEAGARGAVWTSGGLLSVLAGSTTIGSTGLGSVTVSNGIARLRDVVLGKFAGATGSLTMVGGTVSVYTSLTLGDCVLGSTGNLLMSGGSLFVTNAAHTAALYVRKGKVMLSGGTMFVDRIVVTNTCGQFIQSGGTLGTNVVILSANLDADGDGMPNGWEQQYRLDPFSPADANLDADGDGLSNLSELLAGTDPTNSASAFRITAIAREGNNIRVTWSTVPGKTNALQRALTIGGSYASVFTVTNTVGTTTNFLDVGVLPAASTRSYRIRLVP